MDIDVSDDWAPNSEQMDAIDLPKPRIFTVTSATRNSDKNRPVNIHLAEFDRPWRPGKSMGRVLRWCWGPKTATWVGRRVELFCDPEVTYGKDKVGGIRVSRLSHITDPQRVPLLVSQGRASVYTVTPLPDAPAVRVRDWRAEADALTDLDDLRSLWKAAPEDMREYIAARVTDVQTSTPPTEA